MMPKYWSLHPRVHGLVEDHDGVIGNDGAEIAAAQRQVGEEQVMVDNDDVDPGRAVWPW